MRSHVHSDSGFLFFAPSRTAVIGVRSPDGWKKTSVRGYPVEATLSGRALKVLASVFFTVSETATYKSSAQVFC